MSRAISGVTRTITLDLSACDATLVIDLLNEQQQQSIENAVERIELEPYDYRWLRVDGQRHTSA